MKNKKLIYGLVVVVALLCVSIGYAAITKDLVIGGTLSTDYAGAGNLLVQFDENKANHVAYTFNKDDSLEHLSAEIVSVDKLSVTVAAGGFKYTGSINYMYFAIPVINSEGSDFIANLQWSYTLTDVKIDGVAVSAEDDIRGEHYFDVFGQFSDTSDQGNGRGITGTPTKGTENYEILQIGETTYFVFRVDLKKAPLGQLDATLTINITATAAAEKGAA